MNRASSHVAGIENERESAPPAVNVENEQPDTPYLPTAADTLDYSLQTTIHQNPTLMQPILLAPPTLHVQNNETPQLELTSRIANNYSMYTRKAILTINGNLKGNDCTVD